MFAARLPFQSLATVIEFSDSARRLLPHLEKPGLDGRPQSMEQRWRRIADAGWLSILVPESLGGLGLDQRHLCGILYEEGRVCTGLPVMETAMHAVSVLLAAPASSLRNSLLERISRGELIVGVAWQDTHVQWEAGCSSVKTVARSDGLRMTGLKRMVSPALMAGGWLVLATEDDNPMLVWIPGETKGVEVIPNASVDGTDVGELSFDSILVPPTSILAEGPATLDIVEFANDWTRIACACALLGSSSRLFEDTLEYLNTRIQFDRPLATNQALQHRMVNQYIQLELTVAGVENSLEIALKDPSQLGLAASRAKAQASELSVSLGMEAVQLHGAIGYTDELPVGRLWKRALHLHGWLGAPRLHLRRSLNLQLLCNTIAHNGENCGIQPGGREKQDAAELAELPIAEFRLHIRRFLHLHCPASLRNAPNRLRWGQLRSWYQTLGRHGLLAPSWPESYGGMGLPPEKVLAYHDELESFGSPRLHDQGLTLVGPTLIQYGTKAQQETYLPRILDGEHVWCQGYSEPNAGSDLASLRTRATVDGDTLVINGQKIWTTLAQDATHMFALVRTGHFEVKQQGISFVLIDLSLAGVRIRPIKNIAGDEEFCEVFLDNVRVPLNEIVGQLHGGWKVAKALLEYEKLFNGSPKMCVRAMHLLKEVATHLHLFDKESFCDEFGAAALDVHNLQCLYAHYERIVRDGERLPQSVSTLKVHATETYVRIARLLAESITESDAGISEQFPGLIRPYSLLMHAIATRIYGGSNEIQRNVIAKRVLGMPA